MKNIFTAILFSTLITSVVNAQTSIPGGPVSGTWNLAGSPYLINGHIIIQNGATLTIDPGVTVSFQGSFNFYVQGRLIAVGTSADTINFAAADTATGFLGIRFDNTPLNNDTSKFIYCKIEYGKATTGIPPQTYGGAIFVMNFSKIAITNSLIRYCVADGGGGIYCEGSNIRFSNNTISYNRAIYDGGGILWSEVATPGTVIFSNNNITFNSSGSGGGIAISVYAADSFIFVYNIVSFNLADGGGNGGGGISMSGENVAIRNNLISNNIAMNGAGGGISVVGLLSGEITDNNIISNSATSGGGGVGTFGSSPLVSKNTIAFNVAGAGGGGIDYSARPGSNSEISYNKIYNNTAGGGGGLVFGTSLPDSGVLSNNLIVNNTAIGYGGGIYTGGETIIINCTISNNSALNGGGLFCGGSDPLILNTILWGDSATNGNEVFLFDETCDPNFYNNNIEGGLASFDVNGTFYLGNYINNQDSVPMFTSPTAGSGASFNAANSDWTLQGGSICINHGITFLNWQYDLQGLPREVDCTTDIGAYEYQIATNTAIVTPNGPTSFCDGGSVVLTVSQGATYSWSTGETTQSISVSSSGNYSVNVTFPVGCAVNTNTSPITVTVYPSPNVSFSGLADTICIASGAQPLLGNPSGGSFSGTGIVGNAFDPGISGVGNFTVIYSFTDSLGCSDSATMSVYVDVCSGQNELNKSSPFTVDPNPTHNFLYISLERLISGLQLEIFNLFGEKMYSFALNNKQEKINIEGFAAGIYFVKILSGEYSSVKKLVVE